MVPVASIACMAVSAVVGVGLPVGLFLGLRKRLSLQVVPMIVGVAVFVLFAMVLEQTLHMVVLRPQPDGTMALRDNNPALYVLYGIFAAGIFEETGRLVAFLALKRFFKGVRTAVSYGIGHGGIEAILLLSLPMVSDIVLSMVINADPNGQIASALPAATRYALVGTAPAYFLVGGGERILAIAIQLSLSLLVWIAVTHKGRWWLFPLAILLHAVCDTPAAIAQTGHLSVGLTEGVTAVAAVAVSAYALWWFRRCRAEEIAPPLPYYQPPAAADFAGPWRAN